MRNPWFIEEAKTVCGLAYKIGEEQMFQLNQGCCIIYDDFPPPGKSPLRQKAEFIVRAVNNHEDLVDALDEILNYSGGANNALEDEYVMERAAAALSKARGEGETA